MIVTVDLDAQTPVYEQIVTQITEAIRRGDVAPGAQLPTVRQLAGDLGVAVNTVAKAYKQLEAEGYVATRGRNGTVVRGAAPTDDELSAAATLLARAAQRHGLELNAAVGLLRRAW